MALAAAAAGAPYNQGLVALHRSCLAVSLANREAASLEDQATPAVAQSHRHLHRHLDH